MIVSALRQIREDLAMIKTRIDALEQAEAIRKGFDVDANVHSLQKAVFEIYQTFHYLYKRQQPLGSEFEAVLNDNIDDLYEE